MRLFKVVFIYLLILSSVSSYAQQASVKLSVYDSLNGLPIRYVTFTLIKSQDSILQAYTRSNEKGNLILTAVPYGKYVFTISKNSFVDYFDTLIIDNPFVDLGQIKLIAKAKLLENVVVQQKIAAIRLKGDTIEYKADSFKVDKNANVQELLKRMPGISVNGKGEITAQGQSVQKVLVDGEEFFSDDPAVVTKNLRADAIDKIQVFDKKSDQATFTGIDDGVKNKTINLQLKEDKKNGYFGKVEAGTDLGNYRYGKAMANVFKGKQKLAGYLTTDNTAYESLNWNERSNYGEDLNRTTEFNEDGGMSMWSSGDEFSWGQGFPNSTTGGLHYSKKWKDDKVALNNTYQFNQIDVNGGAQNTNQTLVSDSVSLFNKEIQKFNTSKNRNRLRSTLNWKIDTTSDLKFIVTASKVNTKVSDVYDGNTKNSNQKLINTTSRNNSTNANEEVFIGNLTWRKRLKKKGRTISLAVDGDLTNHRKDIALKASNIFYNDGNTVTQSVDQAKTDNEDKFNIKSKLAYTEPLFKNTFIELNATYQQNSNNAERNTYEKQTGSLNYNVFIDSLSTQFRFVNTGIFAGTSFKYQNKKVNISVGTGFGKVNFALTDKLRADNRNVDFINWQPLASFTYNPKKQIRYNIAYNGKNRNPNLLQIQPFRDNSNPLNVTIGNPFLKQEFEHTIEATFSKYQVIKSKNMYVNAAYTITENAITNANTLDAKTGKNINQAVNVNGNESYRMWASYGFDLFPSFNVSFNLNPSFNKFVNVVNGIKNINKSANYSFSIQSGYWGDKWINYWFNIGPAYNVSSSTINPTETKFWNWNGNYDISFKWKKKRIYLYVNGEVNLYQNTSTFNNNANVWLLNIYLKKAIDKEEKWEFQVGVHDLLNQNQNINRSIMSNFISENIRQVIQRYGMISLTYNFSKNGKPSNGW